jgi:hypothetical protein
MTQMPPETRASQFGGTINPGKTVLIKIAGVLVVAVAGMIFLYSLVLALAFGGQTPLLSLLTSSFFMILIVVATAGVGLILHARKRDRLHREAFSQRRRGS